MLPYFSLTLFISATLLFLVQPMIGKMILPQLGGTPSVWNTCMVFFQGVLLVGYGYTHFLTTTQPPRRQVLIHMVLLALPFLVLPFSLGSWEPDTDTSPFVVFTVLLGQLCVMVGLPFLAVSTTAPLIQKWFGHTDSPAAKDPYFLYGASNFGSMIGLMAYPFVIEQYLPVTPEADGGSFISQVHFWTLGYAVFVALVVGCAVVVWQAIGKKSAEKNLVMAAVTTPVVMNEPVSATTAATAITSNPRRRVARLDTGMPKEDRPIKAAAPVPDGPNDDITIWRRLRWIGLAAAPTSLMLGVTTFMTTDIAPVTSFWILPLALYLLTFILVFARWPVVWTGTPHTVVMFVQPCAILFLVLKMNAHEVHFPEHFIVSPTAWEFVLNLGAFFATTLMCHGELAKDRPSTKHLTEFFLWMSVGGVLGGLFNAIFAPIVFQYGLLEYPIAMAFACLLRSNMVEPDATLIPGDSTGKVSTPLGYVLDLAFPILIGVACFLAVNYCGPHQVGFFLFQRKFLIAGLVVGVLAMSLRPMRFGLSIAALFLAVGIHDRLHDPLVYEGRGFFGPMKVRDSEWERHLLPKLDEGDNQYVEHKVYRTLIHGGINHGRQIIEYKDSNGLESAEMTLKKRREPITYFHERNGVAEVYHKLSWPNAQPPAGVVNITGLSDNRLPMAMFGLACGADAPWGLLANTQSEPPYAVLGLGTGILACYAKAYQTVDFYEIDPLVRDLSVPKGYVPPWSEERLKNPKLTMPDPTFFFVQDAAERWANIAVKMGDGRLVLKKEPNREKYYHVIALDAFSSDAIPVHLLTKDAIKVYLDKLTDGGVLLFNTTNRYVRIEPVLSAIAKDMDLECLYCPDFTDDHRDHPDRFSADWVVLRRKTDEKHWKNGGPPLGIRLPSERKLIAWNGRPYANAKNSDSERRWHEVEPLPGPVWTDGYSNLFKIIRWR